MLNKIEGRETMSRLSTINNRVRKALNAGLRKNKNAEVYIVNKQDMDRWKEQGLNPPDNALVIVLSSKSI